MATTKNRRALCSARGCNDPVAVEDLCMRCYKRRWSRRRSGRVRGSAAILVDPIWMRCAVEGCRQTLLEEGLCVVHLKEIIAATKSRRRAIVSNGTSDNCGLRGCNHPATARGVCEGHREELLRIGSQLAERLSSSRPKVQFDYREITLDEIDISDGRFAMRLDLGKIGNLAASVAELGMIHNVVVWQREDGALVPVCGNRRFHSVVANAAIGIPPPQIFAKIAPTETPPEMLKVIAAHENMRRDAISRFEMAALADRLRRAGESIPSIARQLGVNMDTAARFLNLVDKAIPRLFAAFCDGQVSLGVARLIWPLPPRQQNLWLDRVLNQGLQRDALAAALRKWRTKQDASLVERLLTGKMKAAKVERLKKRAPYGFYITANSRKRAAQVARLLAEWEQEDRE